MPKFALVAAVAGALLGCDGNDSGRQVQTDDQTPPGKLTMDAHVPQANGQLTTVTVTPTSGNRSMTLTNLPAITLIADSADQESAIADVRIVGETNVTCKGEELAQNKHASWLKAAAPSPQPQFARAVSLAVKLGRQDPGDRPGADFIAHCPPDMRLTSVSGEFSASATNGVNMTLRTASFGFRWVRP